MRISSSLEELTCSIGVIGARDVLLIDWQRAIRFTHIRFFYFIIWKIQGAGFGLFNCTTLSGQGDQIIQSKLCWVDNLDWFNSMLCSPEVSGRREGCLAGLKLIYFLSVRSCPNCLCCWLPDQSVLYTARRQRWQVTLPLTLSPLDTDSTRNGI